MDELKKVKFTVPHWVTLGAMTFLGAVVGNFRSDPFTMFSNASGIKAAIAGALLAGFGTLVALAQRSIIPAVNVRAAMLHTAAKAAAPVAMILLGLASWGFCIFQVACSGLTPAQVQTGGTVALDTAICVLRNIATIPQPSPAAIAVTCGIDAADCAANPNTCLGASQVVQLLDAHKAAEIREQSISTDGGVK